MYFKYFLTIAWQCFLVAKIFITATPTNTIVGKKWVALDRVPSWLVVLILVILTGLSLLAPFRNSKSNVFTESHLVLTRKLKAKKLFPNGNKKTIEHLT